MGEGSEGLTRTEGRHLYGSDPVGYTAGRPEYPEWVYERLHRPCGLSAGATVVEIGPGTGMVTRRLLAAGARVVAIEPDAQLAAHLRVALPGGDVKVVESTFEAADLTGVDADLVVAATSFHWVPREPGMRQLAAALRPGGYAALWWTLFFDRCRPDAFAEATAHLLPAVSADFNEPGRPEFQLDVEQRCSDLINGAGLVEVRAEVTHWEQTLTTGQVRDLYASMAVVRRLPPDQQGAILAELSRIADEEFAGAVRRPFITALYSGRFPG